MNEQEILTFLLKDGREDLDVQVDVLAANRIIQNFESRSRASDFIVFRTAMGNCIGVNLVEVQGIRRGPTASDPSNCLAVNAYSTRIQLKDRKVAIESARNSDVDLADFINGLELGPEVVACPIFVDSHGDELMVDARQVIFVIAPGAQVDAGYEQFCKDSEQS